MKKLPQKVFSVFILIISLNVQSQTLNPTYGFIKNQGQVVNQDGRTNSEVNYLLPLNQSLNIQLRKRGFSYDTYSRLDSESTIFQRIDVEFLNAQANPKFVEEHLNSDYINYYTSGLSNNEAYKTKHCQSILVKEIYPNIDLRYSIKEGQERSFKFDFILHPGANINDIQIKYTGYDSFKYDIDLIFELSQGELVEKIPASWIVETGEQIKVDYRIVSQDSESVILGYSAAVKITSTQNTLLIDPELSMDWGNYYGDTQNDVGTDVMTDNHGHVYMCGYTQSYTNLATSGVHQDTMAGGLFDAFVLKTDELGNKMWSTYYGGTGTEITNEIMVDTFFNVTITGYTDSPDGIASSSCYQNNLAGGTDAFIAQFNSNGLRIWSTYFGGLGDEKGISVDTDYDGNLYIAGSTEGSSNLATAGAYQTSNAGMMDGYLAKLDIAGFPVWSSYYGGPADDWINSIAQEWNNIVIAGVTNSNSNISTAASHQPNLAGSTDAFLASFDQAGVRNWATYYGDDEMDEAADVEIYNTRIYMIGKTESDSNIVTAGAYKMMVDSVDAYLVKFDTLGNRMWGTYFGGEANDEAIELGVELDSNIYIFGNTYSASNLASTDNYDTTYNGNSDAFIAKFHYTGSFLHSSYYGGIEDDILMGGDVFGNTAVYVCGSTNSPDSIAFNPNIQDSLAGMTDAFLTRFNTKYSTACSAIGGGFIADTICQDTICLTVQGGALGQGASWVWYKDGCGINGTQIYIGDTLCILPDTGFVSIYVRAESVNNSTACSWINFYVLPNPTAIITANDSVFCAGEILNLSSNQASTYQWTGPDNFIATIQDTLVDTLQTIHSGTYELLISDDFGCEAMDSVQIEVFDLPTISSVVTPTSCASYTDGEIIVSINGVNPLNYSWLNFASTQLTISNLASSIYVFSLTDSNSCTAIDSIFVPNPPSFILGLSSTPNNCTANNGSILLSVIGSPSNYIYSWLPAGQTSQNITNLSDGNYSVIVTDSTGCSNSSSTQVVLIDSLEIDTLTFTDLSCFESQDGTAQVIMSYGQAPFVYNWQPTNQSANSISNLEAGVYTMTVTDDFGCIRIDSVFISQPDSIFIHIDSLFHAFCDEKVGSVYITASGGTGSIDYLWTPTGSTDSYLELLLAGYYTILVTDSFGCQSNSTIEIINYGSPVVSINASSISVSAGQVDTLEAIVSPSSVYSYSWSPTSSLNCSNCQTVEASPTIQTTYNVNVVDTNGCEATADITISIDRCTDYYLPTIFSPNGDNQNDTWTVMGECFESFNLTVFNRWGELIYSANSNDNPWDGTYKGKQVEMGAYVYQLELSFGAGERESVSGSIKIVR